MQSRSIDSFVHAIHSMQYFDTKNVNFADPIQKLRYGDHMEANYPNFAGTLNCESCHAAGVYEVPDQLKSLPSIASASYTIIGWDRNIATVPSYVTGPASRACGGCHRAQAINEDDATKLLEFNQHTGLFGTLVAAGTGTTNLDAVTQNILAMIGGPTTALVAPTGTQIESCEICHPTAGADHQAKFNAWKDGL
jgi:hypothetical protein